MNAGKQEYADEGKQENNTRWSQVCELSEIREAEGILLPSGWIEVMLRGTSPSVMKDWTTETTPIAKDAA